MEIGLSIVAKTGALSFKVGTEFCFDIPSGGIMFSLLRLSWWKLCMFLFLVKEVINS